MNWQEILAAILMVAVVLIAIFIFTGLYREIFGGDIFGGQISQEEQQVYEGNFDKLETNILACKNIADSNCLCAGFPSFPGTFKGKLHLTSDVRDMIIELKINEKTISSAKLENIFITGVLVEKQGLNFEKVSQQLDIYREKTIDFTRNPPQFDRKDLNKFLWWGLGEPKVIDSRLYKNEQGVIHIMLGYEDSPEIAIRLSELRECGKQG